MQRDDYVKSEVFGYENTTLNVILHLGSRDKRWEIKLVNTETGNIYKLYFSKEAWAKTLNSLIIQTGGF